MSLAVSSVSSVHPGSAELVAHWVPWIYLPSTWHFVLGDLPRAERGACHGLAEQEVMSLKPQLQQKCKEDGEGFFVLFLALLCRSSHPFARFLTGLALLDGQRALTFGGAVERKACAPGNSPL